MPCSLNQPGAKRDGQKCPITEINLSPYPDELIVFDSHSMQVLESQCTQNYERCKVMDQPNGHHCFESSMQLMIKVELIYVNK